MKFEVPQSQSQYFLFFVKSSQVPVYYACDTSCMFLGLLNLFSRALGQVVHLMTRKIYSCLKPAYNAPEPWGSSTTLSITAI